MPKTLEKTRKQIAKKKNGAVDALHQNSRDSRRLHRALVRDERLEKIAESRQKRDQPLLERVAFFQQFVEEAQSPVLDLETVQSQIERFVHQYDEELEEAKRARRPGRPASAREDLLKMKIAALEKEHRNGFFLPDLTAQDNVQLLGRWEGSWSYLANLAWVRVSSNGDVKTANFPPNGIR